MKKVPDKTKVSHDKWMITKLREDPSFATDYVKAALEDTQEPRVALTALRRVAEARGGIAKIARKAGIERESLHRALSSRGNPRFSTLTAIAKALGFRLSLEAIVEDAPAKRKSA